MVSSFVISCRSFCLFCQMYTLTRQRAKKYNQLILNKNIYQFSNNFPSLLFKNYF